ncbi:MAG TPA: NAD(P)-dependent oxidoreductase [Cyclobacteriaceae bacterium]|nr:NAD(P)-dependent oxidoreductase [Cyclobacteriaceae bacterium]
MKVLVTGSTGFVGRHVVPRLLEKGHEVVAMVRSMEKAMLLPWFEKVCFALYDLHDQQNAALKLLFDIDAVIHLAWQGLPNYKAQFHFEENLPAHYRFLKMLVNIGIKQILVTGTCLEYGMQNGPLAEDMSTQPTNPYALAKDTLRKSLQALQQNITFKLQWVRLFYMYGPGQNSNSLLAQLDRAIDNLESVFNMSGGEQLRDYLPVEEVARRIVMVLEHQDVDGIINCCNSQPISVRRLVEQRIFERNAHIELNLGYYPYPDYEPMAFWGDGRRFAKIMGDDL